MADVDHSSEEALNPEQANRRLPNAFILFCKSKFQKQILTTVPRRRLMWSIQEL